MEKRTKFSLGYFLAIFLLGWALDSMIFSGSADKEIPYSEFRQRLANNKIESVVIAPDKLYGLMKMPDSTKNTTPDSTKQATSDSARKASLDSSKRATLNLAQQADSTNSDHSFTPHSPHTPWALKLVGAEDGHKRQFTVIPLPDDKLLADLQAHGVEYRGKNATDWLSSLFFNMKYTRLGAKLPKGVLLVGPPGSGKTLLARAVAGEAAVPFFSLSGSDFVEMFVGVGAARVRDLFAQAKTKAPRIIFIDEIDAIGKSRGQGVITAGYDERENTLNQLLVEMDGFDASIGIIMMGATNRPDVLDPALLRPGRFDRQILVDRPDLNGRMEIFKVHTRWLLLNNKVDLRKLAAQTPGFAGAEIANVCNEAALLASRRGRDQITMADFQDAIERVIAGLEKKNKLINVLERKIVAYHESGHAIVGHFTPGVDPVQKVSIVPRGIGALGYTLQTPLEDRYLMSRSELIGKIKGLLGGRAAEEVVFGEISTGASNDLERATKIARDMFVVYGMSTRVPNISLVEREQNRLLGQGPMMSRRSEKIEQIVDEEVLEMINSCYETDKVLLQEKRKQLEKMAQTLLEKETIDEKDILAILGPRPKI